MRKRKNTDSSSDLLNTVTQAMLDKKAQQVISLNLKYLTHSVADYFVICNADSRTQVNAIADHIVGFASEKLQSKPFHSEGFENSEWILIDYVDVVVHVFLTPTRSFFQLEQLWADAEIVNYND